MSLHPSSIQIPNDLLFDAVGQWVNRSHQYTSQIIQLHKSKFCLITWDQTCGFVLQVYFTDAGAKHHCPTTSEAALIDGYGWKEHVDSLCIVNITTAKKNTRSCGHISLGILFKHYKTMTLCATENVWCSFNILKDRGRSSLQDVTATTLEPINLPDISTLPISLHHSLIIYRVYCCHISVMASQITITLTLF